MEEKRTALDVYNDLSLAQSKTQFLAWAITSASCSGELMGSDQQDGLALILQEIDSVMKEALEYDLVGKVPEPKAVKLA